MNLQPFTTLIFFDESDDVQDEFLYEPTDGEIGVYAPEEAGIKEASDEIIVKYMHAFFDDRTMSYGGPIRFEQLITEDNIELVKGLDLVGGIQIAYKAMQTVTCDTIISMLDEIKSSGIPKIYAGGILVLYIELCLGFDIP